MAEVAASDDEVELVLVEGRLGLVDVAAGLGHALRQEVALHHRERTPEHVLRRREVRPQELVCKECFGLRDLNVYRVEQKNLAKFSDTFSVGADGLCIGTRQP